MAHTRGIVALALAGVLAVACAGCATNGVSQNELSPGSVCKTQSGLTFTVPEGASATLEPLDDRTLSESIVIELDTSVVVRFMSWSDGNRNELDQDEIALSADGTVVVLALDSAWRGAVIETDLPGCAQGRVLIAAPATSPETRHDAELAQAIWSLLDIHGATLPSGSASSL